MQSNMCKCLLRWGCKRDGAYTRASTHTVGDQAHLVEHKWHVISHEVSGLEEHGQVHDYSMRFCDCKVVHHSGSVDASDGHGGLHVAASVDRVELKVGFLVKLRLESTTNTTGRKSSVADYGDLIRAVSMWSV